MSAPWEKYQTPQSPGTAGPWTKYGSPEEATSPGFLDTVSNAADKVTSTIPAVAGLMAPTLGLAQYAGQKINEASGQLGEAVTEKVATEFPNAPTAVPVGLGTAASIFSNPMTYMDPGSLGVDTRLDAAKGKPGFAARIKQMRTGVEASGFERLRRDPSAFFQRVSREDAGKALGKAKAEAGINPGVTGDIRSLTEENVAKARSHMSVASKAQDQIVEDITAATKLLGKDAPIREIVDLAKITPDQTSTALKGINTRLTRLERLEGKGSPNFQQWSAIKNHFQHILETVAPKVREQNQAFSRVALRDKFMEPFPVNQSGTMSKIDTFGFSPAVAGAGAVVGGPIGAAAALAVKTAARSPFVAGLGTAVRGLADKAIDPVLSRGINYGAKKAGLIGTAAQDERRRSIITQFVEQRSHGR